MGFAFPVEFGLGPIDQALQGRIEFGQNHEARYQEYESGHDGENAADDAQDDKADAGGNSPKLAHFHSILTQGDEYFGKEIFMKQCTRDQNQGSTVGSTRRLMGRVIRKILDPDSTPL